MHAFDKGARARVCAIPNIRRLIRVIRNQGTIDDAASDELLTVQDDGCEGRVG